MRFPIVLALLSCAASAVQAAKPAHSYDSLVQCAAYLRISAAMQQQDGDEENAAYTASLSRNLQKRAEARAGKAKAVVEADIVRTKAELLSRFVTLDGEALDSFTADMDNDCATVIGMD